MKKYFCSYGTLPNECPTCDWPSFSDEILFFNSVEEYAQRVWDSCCSEELGMLYSSETQVPLFDNGKELGRHCCTGVVIRECGSSEIIYRTSDNGQGRQELRRVSDGALVSGLIKD